MFKYHLTDFQVHREGGGSVDEFYAQNLNRIKLIQALFYILLFHSFLISRIAGTIPSKPRKIGMFFSSDVLCRWRYTGRDTDA